MSKFTNIVVKILKSENTITTRLCNKGIYKLIVSMYSFKNMLYYYWNWVREENCSKLNLEFKWRGVKKQPSQVISTIDNLRFKLNFESTDGQSDLVHFYEHAIIYFEGEINLRLSSKLV